MIISLIANLAPKIAAGIMLNTFTSMNQDWM